MSTALQSPSNAEPHEQGCSSDLPLEVVERETGKGAERSASKRRPSRFVPLLPVLLAIMAGGVAGHYLQPPGLRAAKDLLGLKPASKAPTPAQNATVGQDVVALGTLLPESEVITLALPYGAGDARIASIEVEEGERVETGDLLAVLDSADLLDAAVEAARAELAVNAATLEEQKASVRASREEAEAALGRAKATADNAERERERAQTLVQRGAISKSVTDQRETAYRQAEREVAEAEATLSRYRSEAVDAQPDVVVAARQVDAARADLMKAEREAEAARIRAPMAGTVLDIHVHPGEQPAEDGLMDLGDIDHMMAEIQVYQTEISRVALGQHVEIGAEALPQPLAGEVVRIGLEVGRQTLVADDPAANTDARVIEVDVALDQSSEPIAAGFTNLQVTARIQTGDDP